MAARRGVDEDRAANPIHSLAIMFFDGISPRNESDLVQVVIDTPRGSRNKFKYDEKQQCFRLSHILPSGLVFPYDFGSVPGTRADDGDALDVLVLMDDPTFCGCLVTVKLIGVLAATQTEKGNALRNDRLLAVPQTPVNPPLFATLREVDSRRLDEIEAFFVAYNKAHGRTFKPRGRSGAEKAEALLNTAIRKYQRA